MTTSTLEVVFEDPPVSRGGRAVTAPNPTDQAFATVLRDRPGDWALYDRYPSQRAAASIANRVKAAKVAPWNEGRWEATTRKVSDDEWKSYVRYVGADDGEYGDPSAVALDDAE